jgi:hypothetical protein
MMDEYFIIQVEKHEFELQTEKQQKSNLKKQLNYHETIYGSVPAAAGFNKTSTSNKRPREEQTPVVRAKQV